MTSTSRKRTRDAASSVELSGGQSQHSRMIEMWRSQILVDFEICVAGTVYKAHKNVLAAGSDYFRALLTGAGAAMAQSSAPHELPDLTRDTWVPALEFLYSGRCSVPEDRLHDLLQAAARLQADELRDAVAGELASKVSSVTAPAIWELGCSLALEQLQVAAKRAALADFAGLTASEAFTKLTAPQLTELLEHDMLNVDAEEDVFLAVVAWRAANKPPAADLEAILRHVRFPRCARSFLDNVKAHMTTVPNGHQILLDAFETAHYEPSAPINRLRGVPSGVQSSIPESFLNGWTKLFEYDYSHASTLEELMAVPQSATYVFIGARDPEGNIALGAVGSRGGVLQLTGGADETHEDNGVYWYFWPERSFGFSPVPEVELEDADILGMGDDEDDVEHGRFRLSWHLEGSEGWRAGRLAELGEGHGPDGWKKLAYYHH